ncbi:hypothetical protein PCANC_08769 [Puccinia coronata f. sp. avenae]|uniref:Uncharacterized protein n=1 Tax=Puccinia coronata f. sp. avenae TaxID=200324 RepID=A0A2N5T1W6_9BASI|nr:hypothetical protein PCANC_08769 [Puccinia coronata f. sp. avenae]
MEWGNPINPKQASNQGILSLRQSTRITLPEKLAWMAASKFLSDVAIQFKLRRAPPSESLTRSNSAARAFGHQV